MLHDPSHHTPPPVAQEIKLTDNDTEILRRLAGETAQIASLPVHKEKARLMDKAQRFGIRTADGLDQ